MSIVQWQHNPLLRLQITKNVVFKNSILVLEITKCLVVFIFNLGGEVVPHVSHVRDAVLHHQGHVGGHGEGHLAGETAGLGEHGEVPGGEGQIDGLLHLDGHGLLLLVHVGGLCELDVANTDVTGGGELDALLCAGDDDGLSELRQISHLR